MKNVMVKAWELAKKGQQKFGGRVSEYLAEALKMAWALIKKEVKEMADKFGFKEMRKMNGELHFILDDIEDMEVSYLSEKEGVHGTYTKRTELKPYQTGYAEKLGKSVRVFKIAFNNKVEIKTGDKTETFEITNGNISWA